MSVHEMLHVVVCMREVFCSMRLCVLEGLWVSFVRLVDLLCSLDRRGHQVFLNAGCCKCVGDSALALCCCCCCCCLHLCVGAFVFFCCVRFPLSVVFFGVVSAVELVLLFCGCV